MSCDITPPDQLINFLQRILEKKKEYSYVETEDPGKPRADCFPPLCVDSPLSMLKDIYNLQFVFLRKYIICEYQINDKVN